MSWPMQRPLQSESKLETDLTFDDNQFLPDNMNAAAAGADGLSPAVHALMQQFVIRSFSQRTLVAHRVLSGWKR